MRWVSTILAPITAGHRPTQPMRSMRRTSMQYTVMSYFTAANTGADWIASDGRQYYAQTPMLHDIMAIQAIYGADTIHASRRYDVRLSRHRRRLAL